MSEDDEDSYRREAERFFWLVGYAIAEWAHVDRALFDLCKWTLNTSDEKTAVIFYKNPSMGDHLSTVNELMKISLGMKRSPVWAKIHKKTYDLLPFRNDIAHNPATQVVQLYGHFKKPGEEWKEPPVSPPPKSWWAIQTEPRKLLRSTRTINARKEELRDHIIELRALLNDYWSFQRSLPKRPLKRPPRRARPTSPQGANQGDKRSRTRTKPRVPPPPSRA
jgi:hypothetical protein